MRIWSGGGKPCCSCNFDLMSSNVLLLSTCSGYVRPVSVLQNLHAKWTVECVHDSAFCRIRALGQRSKPSACRRCTDFRSPATLTAHGAKQPRRS